MYFTRERHRAERAYFGPFSSAKRVRETLDLLGQLFPYRTCDGPEPGRASGSPCLDYYIKRCQAPCVDYISEEDYRANIDAIIRFLSGRYRQIERELEQRMAAAAEAQEFEQAAVFRNRLRAVRSLFERQRVASGTVGTLDVLAVAVDGTDANAQVFQVRDGVLADRQSFYLENRAGRSEAEVAEEFAIQYYATSLSIPGGDRRAGLARARPTSCGRRSRSAARRRSSCATRSAATSAACTSWPSATRGSRSSRTSCAPSAAASSGWTRSTTCARRSGMDALPVRIEGFDISNLGPSHTVASMVVFEGGAPRKADYRRFKIRALEGRQDDFAAMQEVLSRRMAQWVEQRDRSPHDPSRDASFAALPALIVIDGGQGPALERRVARWASSWRRA